MSVGIAATLIAIGVIFVQAGRVASRIFGARTLSVYAPRVSAVLITCSVSLSSFEALFTGIDAVE